MEHFNDNRNIWIVDTTLRDGEQAPGVVFDTDDRMEIARSLARVGIDEIEAGIPAMGEAACQDIKRLTKAGLPCVLSSWCRATEQDLLLAAQCNTSGVHISFPTSSLLLKTFDRTENWVLERLESLVNFAKQHFDQISVGAQDATRTRWGFIERFSRQAQAVGVGRLRLADTVGMISPTMVINLVSNLKKVVPGLDVEFHGHNDLGMATANAVTAVDCGADAVSVTVNGLGERAGNASLEEVVMALFELGSYKKKIDTFFLADLCHLVAKASGRVISDSKPIVGSRIFAHESGIHCSGLLKDPSSYQLFQPEKVGNNSCEYVIGYHTGSSAISHVLEQQGIHVSKSKAKQLLALVRKTVLEQKKTLTPVQLKQLYNIS